MNTQILFVPASGPVGSGEYYRCLALARILKRRCPEIEIAFLLNRAARVELEPTFDYHLIDDTPARATHEVDNLLERIRPALAVFDCTGRVVHFRRVQRQGGRVVWISNRPGKRRRGFSPRVLPWINLHVMADQPPGLPLLSLRERLAIRFFGTVKVVSVGAIAPDVETLDESPAEHSPYAVFVSGGGGYHSGNQPVPEIFLEAAVLFRQKTGMAARVVMGPQYTGNVVDHESVEVIGSLPTGELSRLLAGSQVAVVGAGYMLSSQALSLPIAVVVTAVGGMDQPERVRRLQHAGFAETARLNSEELARQAAQLVKDQKRAKFQCQARETAGFGDGLGAASDALLAQLKGR